MRLDMSKCRELDAERKLENIELCDFYDDSRTRWWSELYSVILTETNKVTVMVK